jgi:putative ABC transport system ATP-binding protein
MTSTAATPSVFAGAPEAAIVSMRDVTKTYGTEAGEVHALAGVSLDVAAGDFVAIMGPSGSGKSTLMHIMGCLDGPSAGGYELAGVDVSRMSEAELADVRNQRIGFVFQQFNLLASMPAWRNVELPLCYAGVHRTERRRRALEALERVGLGDRTDHRPGEMSGGQQQRVAVARALVTDPALILADEPTGNLHSAQGEEIMELFTRLNRQGTTIVQVTHSERNASYGHRTIHLHDGWIAEPSPTEAAGQRG